MTAAQSSKAVDLLSASKPPTCEEGMAFMKTAVVFQSRYGSTKRYAKWIAEELSCDLWDRKKIKAADLQPYHTIVYGGGLYAGGVLGADLLAKHFQELRHKNLILFTCGLADPANTSNTDSIRKSLGKVLTPPMQDAIQLFHLRGAIDYQKLRPIHKAMMAALHHMIAKKDAGSLSDEDKEMLATYGKAVDFIDQAAILPLIHYVRGLERSD